MTNSLSDTDFPAPDDEFTYATTYGWDKSRSTRPATVPATTNLAMLRLQAARTGLGVLVKALDDEADLWRTRFEVSQIIADGALLRFQAAEAALTRANDALDLQRAELETARHDRDWSRDGA